MSSNKLVYCEVCDTYSLVISEIDPDYKLCGHNHEIEDYKGELNFNEEKETIQASGARGG